jgi:uncharacterized protein
LANGWKPSPLNEFVFKIESRCNLNCDYCYVYNLGDVSWRDQPGWMSSEVVKMAANRIREHALEHNLPGVLVSVHGGEPLLRGVDAVEQFVSTVRSALAPVPVRFSMQTNATTVTETVASVLASLDIGVGVSIDGDESSNRHRLDVHGRSSFSRCTEGIANLAKHPGLLHGALCVIDLDNDPQIVLRTIVELGFKSADFLLPHGSWALRPKGKNSDITEGYNASAPYADWLIELFQAWSLYDNPIQIRLFEDILNLLLGGEHAFEGLGLGPARLVVIEADGSIELVDHIGFTYSGAENTGASVFSHALSEVLRHPGVVARQIGEAALPDECRNCVVKTVCGGGLISHRFSEETGFKSATVYCSDLYKLINWIEIEWKRRIKSAHEVNVA